MSGVSAAMLGVPVGRLAEYGTIAYDWSTEDKKAFEAFYFERVQPPMARQFERVRQLQETLRTTNACQRVRGDVPRGLTSLPSR